MTNTLETPLVVSESRIPPDTRHRFDIRRSSLLAVEATSRKVLTLVAIILMASGLSISSFFIEGSREKVILSTLIIMAIGLLITHYFLTRWKTKLLPQSVESLREQGLLTLYQQLSYVNRFLEVTLTETTPLRTVESWAKKLQNEIEAELDWIAKGDIDDEEELNAFEVKLSQYLALSRQAPLLIAKPNIPDNWQPWVIASGIETDPA